MKKAKRGRPKGQARLQREDILRAGLKALDQAGPQGLSMRKIAGHLNVTPMALYHHVADRSELLRDLADLIYAGVLKELERGPGSVREKLELLLLTYHRAVLRHPNLSLAIFADPAAFSLEARRITDKIFELLGDARLTAPERKLWLNVLVDFTHGSSIAAAMSGAAAKPSKSSAAKASQLYREGLNKLLECIF
ncbi:MAG TPA: TetR family transcriptional regulator [Bdellovibrionales bacterium]|nr:TetR family transcriptional regulator [Bdellovibrionales bacterium]